VGASVFFDGPDSPDVGVVFEVEDEDPSPDPLDDELFSPPSPPEVGFALPLVAAARSARESFR
jgi:hypothetical protein